MTFLRVVIKLSG